MGHNLAGEEDSEYFGTFVPGCEGSSGVEYLRASTSDEALPLVRAGGWRPPHLLLG